MDMLILFMLFSSLIPIFLWPRHRKLALTQLPLVMGMWAYFLLSFLQPDMPSSLHAFLAVLFFGNFLYTEFAIIRFCIDYGNALKNNKKEHPAVSKINR